MRCGLLVDHQKLLAPVRTDLGLFHDVAAFVEWWLTSWTTRSLQLKLFSYRGRGSLNSNRPNVRCLCRLTTRLSFFPRFPLKYGTRIPDSPCYHPYGASGPNFASSPVLISGKRGETALGLRSSEIFVPAKPCRSRTASHARDRVLATSTIGRCATAKVRSSHVDRAMS